MFQALARVFSRGARIGPTSTRRVHDYESRAVIVRDLMQDVFLVLKATKTPAFDVTAHFCNVVQISSDLEVADEEPFASSAAHALACAARKFDNETLRAVWFDVICTATTDDTALLQKPYLVGLNRALGVVFADAARRMQERKSDDAMDDDGWRLTWRMVVLSSSAEYIDDDDDVKTPAEDIEWLDRVWSEMSATSGSV